MAQCLKVPSAFALRGPATAHGNLPAHKYENTFNLPSFCLSNRVLSSPEAKCQPNEAPDFGNLNSRYTRMYKENTHLYTSHATSSYPPHSCCTHYSLAFSEMSGIQEDGVCVEGEVRWPRRRGGGGSQTRARFSGLLRVRCMFSHPNLSHRQD